MSEINWKTKWSRDQIKATTLEQFEVFWRYETGMIRTQLSKLEQTDALPHAIIISGLRWVGKSTLLAQRAYQMGQGQFYYLNFEDDRFINFQAEDFNDLYQVLVEIFEQRNIFIIAEILNVVGWEHLVRCFMDQGFKFYISGSNAALLSWELGTRLTGRYVPIELFPSSFKEFFDFRNDPIPSVRRMTTVETTQLRQALEQALK